MGQVHAFRERMAGAKASKATKGGCPYCDAPVKGENLARHLRIVHPGKQGAEVLARKSETETKRTRARQVKSAYRGSFLSGKAVLALAIIGIVVAAGAAAYIYLPRPAQVDELRDPIGLICYGHEKEAMHRHVLLHITVDGQPYNIPTHIGIPQSAGGKDECWRPLHTHAEEIPGKIHIESGVLRAYTIDDFFKIWSIHEGTNLVFDSTHLRLPGGPGNAAVDKDTSRDGGTITLRVDNQPSTLFQNQVLVNPNRPYDGSEFDHHIYIDYNS